MQAAGKFGAAREGGAELGPERRGGGDDHPVAPAERQMSRDQLGDEDDHGQPQRVTARRRLQAGVGAENREVGAQLLEPPARARMGAAVAQAAGLAGENEDGEVRA